MADGAVFGNITDRLKNVYTKVVTRQFAKDQILFALCNRDSKFIKGGGTAAYWYLHTDRNPSAGSYPNGGNYPHFGQQSGVQANAALKNIFTGVQFEEKTLYAAANDQQAFVDVEKYEIQRAMEDLKNEVARQMWMDTTGVLGTVASTATDGSNTKVTLSATAVPRYTPLTRFTRNNGYYTFLASDFSAISSGANVQISTVNDTAGTFEFVTSGGPTLSAGNLVIKEQANTGHSATAGNDLNGVKSIFGTGNIYNVNTTNYSSFVSYIRTQNEDPTEQVFSIMKQNIVRSGSKPDVIVTEPMVVAKYTNLLLTYKRVYIEAGTHEILGGVKTTEDIDALEGPEYIDVGPVIADNNCFLGVNANTAYCAMYESDHLFIQEAGDIHWRDKDGNTLARVTGNPSQPFYQGNLDWFAEVCTDKRNALALHTNMNQQI